MPSTPLRALLVLLCLSSEGGSAGKQKDGRALALRCLRRGRRCVGSLGRWVGGFFCWRRAELQPSLLPRGNPLLGVSGQDGCGLEIVHLAMTERRS